MTDSDMICVGQILSAHGIKGQVRFRSYTEDSSSVFGYSPFFLNNHSQLVVTSIDGVKGGDFIVSFDGISDRNASQNLRGERIFVTRSSLPSINDSEYYFVDLIGLDVVFEESVIGKVVNVYVAGADAVVSIESSLMGCLDIPFNSDRLGTPNLEDGMIELFSFSP